MSQLSVSGSNTSQITISNANDDANVSDVLGNELKKDFDEKTDLSKLDTDENLLKQNLNIIQG